MALEIAAASTATIRHVIADEARLDRVLALVGDDTVVYETPRATLRGAAGFAFQRGVLGVGDRPTLPDVEALVAAVAPAPIAVVEGVTDHENVGALFRNAAAFGIGAVIVDPTTADPLYRRSIRVSIGHVLTVPWTRSPIATTIAALRSAGYATVALTPGGDTDIGAMVRGVDRPVAWLLGAEGDGLDAATMDAADRRVAIPMAAGVDSLNIATAAAVAFALAATET